MANKDNMKKWEEANKKLAEANKKRAAERSTSKTTNPLMKDFKERMEKRELEKAKKEADKKKKDAEGGGSKYGPTAMKAGGTARNFAGNGDGEGYSAKTKVDGSKYSGKVPSKEASKYERGDSKPSTPRRRRATGRDAMMSERQREVAEREERKRKQAQEKGGSNVVGS